MNIRLAKHKDIESINEIYNQAVALGFQTADKKPVTPEQRTKWFEAHNHHYPVFVIENLNKILGWASLSIYRDREALKRTAEISYYIHQEHQQQGLGSALMKYCIKMAPEYGFKTLIAILIDKNSPSIGLLKKFGFEEWGRMPGIVEFDIVSCDHLYYGLHLSYDSHSGSII